MAVALAATQTQTKHIRFTITVSVLNSDDPVRVFEQFATLNGLSNGGAEIIAGATPSSKAAHAAGDQQP